MLNYHCRNKLIDGQALSILYTEFRPVIEAAKGNLSKISVHNHVTEILRHMTVALGDFIIDNPDIL